MDSLFKVGVLYSFIDRISGPVMGVIGKLSALDDKFKGTGATIAKVAAGAAALAVAGGVLGYGLLRQADAAGAFQQELAATGAIADATAAQIAQMHDKALNLGITTGYAPLEAIKGMRELAAVGLTVGETMAVISPSLIFARANQLQLADASGALAAALKGFNWEASRAAEMGDMLTNLTNVSAFRGNELQGSVAGVSAIASAANQSASSVLALMGVIRNTGETAQNSADHARMAITAIMQPSIISMRWAKKAGFDLMNTYRDAAGNILPIAQVFANIEKNTRHMGKANRDLLIGHLLGIGGLQAYQKAMLAVYTTTINGRQVTLHGLAAVEAMDRSLQHSSGTAERFASTQRATWPGIQQMLGGTFATFRVVIGETLLPALSKLVSAFTNTLNAVLQFIIAHKQLFAAVIPMAALLGAAAVAAGGLTIAFIGATWAAARLALAFKTTLKDIPLLIGGLQSATAGLWRWVAASWGVFSIRGIIAGVSAAFAALDTVVGGLMVGMIIGNPFAWAILAIPLIAALGYGLFKLVGGFDGLAVYASAAWGKIADAAAPLVDMIRRDFPAAYAFMAALVEEPMANIGAAWKSMQYAAGYVIGAVIRAFGWLASGISLAATGIYMAVFHPFEAVKNLFATGADLFDSGKKLVMTFVDGIKSVFNLPFETVSALLGKVRQLLPFSDAKEGPLSKLTYSGGAIMGTMADGVRRAAPQLRVAVMAGLVAASPMAIPVPATAPSMPAKTLSVKEIIRESRGESAPGETKQTVIHVHIGNLHFEDMNSFMEFLKAQGGAAV